jgi:hypothetical protein
MINGIKLFVLFKFSSPPQTALLAVGVLHSKEKLVKKGERTFYLLC